MQKLAEFEWLQLSVLLRSNLEASFSANGWLALWHLHTKFDVYSTNVVISAARLLDGIRFIITRRRLRNPRRTRYKYSPFSTQRCLAKCLSRHAKTRCLGYLGAAAIPLCLISLLTTLGSKG